MGDLALDPYTSHGHDGILASIGDVDNDGTAAILAQMGVLAAQAGIDIVAPSDMMDGRHQSFAKTGKHSFLGKAAAAFGFFAEKFPDDPKAVMAMQKRSDCLQALHEWEKAAEHTRT